MNNDGNNAGYVNGGKPPSPDSHPIIPPRGDYQTLHSFHKAEVVYDLTFRFAQSMKGGASVPASHYSFAIHNL